MPFSVPIIFWSAWLILGQKTVFLNWKLCHTISHPPFGVGTWNFNTMCISLRSSALWVFWSTWLILGQKTAFLNLKLCHSISQPPFRVETWSLDIVYFSIMLFDVRKLWLCLTDFGLENYVFCLKTLLGYISSPFQSLDFIFGHNVLQHYFLWSKENFAMHDWFWAKKLHFWR